MNKWYSVRHNLVEEQSRLPALEHDLHSSDLGPSDNLTFTPPDI